MTCCARYSNTTKEAALTLLPDILHYDRARPAHYPNGRVMTDDVFSARMIFMVHGQATPQNIGPHDDLMAAFPFLGKPNPSGTAKAQEADPSIWQRRTPRYVRAMS
jgi:hypothetical protein